MSAPTTEEKLNFLKVTQPTEYELECVGKLERGNYEIGVQRTSDIVDECYEIFMRSCRSSMGVAGDSIVGIFNAQGDLVNASAGTYLHAVIPPIGIKFILQHFQENPGIKDGDIWYCNDALYGGIHNPDQCAFMPIFFDGELVGWSAALSHTTETGAIEPGGMPLSARSRFEEGMNLPPMRVGENFLLRNDIIEMFAAFGIRAEQMVVVDLKARCTTVDRVRMRVQEMCARNGRDFVVGLFRQMLNEAEEGARKRLKEWPDGTFRCVTFSDAVGNKPGLLRNCSMTMTKKDDTLLIDVTGTSPETPSSYNAHPQAVVGHLANYIYEYVFHDLPISSATFQPVDFVFPKNSMLSPDNRAATSNSVMACSGAMSSIANCVSRARYSTSQWKQVNCAPGNGGNASVIAGMSQWGLPFADMIAYPINTEGQGARATKDGMDAYGFPWCAFGRAPDVESIENEFPMMIPFSQHWTDGCGFGKYRGGVGTAQLWVTHQTPMLYFNTISDNSRLQTPQPLYGGYATPTVPGVTVDGVDIVDMLGDRTGSDVDLKSLIEGKFGGSVVSESYGRSTHPVQQGATINVSLSTGGAGYGDPLDREPEAVRRDLTEGFITPWSAREIFGVVLDEEAGRVNEEETRGLRDRMRKDRIKRGKPYQEFMEQWTQRKPPEDILTYFGSWPDGAVVNPVIRP